jgi:hypothetical protein
MPALSHAAVQSASQFAVPTIVIFWPSSFIFWMWAIVFLSVDIGIALGVAVVAIFFLLFSLLRK